MKVPRVLIQREFAAATGERKGKMTASLQSDMATDQEFQKLIEAGLRTLDVERQGLASLEALLRGPLGDPFVQALHIIKQCTGRVIVTGMGKSGHVGQKVAATLASTGTPAYFVHPSEASHGDLGMITSDDVILAFSWSGETAELTSIITYSRRFAVPLISVTSRAESALGQAAEVALVLPCAKEACPHGLAPTTSTLMQLALGDAIAVSLLESKGFTAHEFKIFHPGGQLGANLKFVSDVMHEGDRVPLAPMDMNMGEALLIMTEKSFGCLGIVDEAGLLVGIITDGDLRRNMGPELLSMAIGQIMTREPKTVGPDVLASAALELVNSSNITALFVVDAGKPVGILHIHDLLRAGIA